MMLVGIGMGVVFRKNAGDEPFSGTVTKVNKGTNASINIVYYDTQAKDWLEAENVVRNKAGLSDDTPRWDFPVGTP